MAYGGVLDVPLDKMNQDTYKEVKRQTFGPFDAAVAQNALFAIRCGGAGRVNYIFTDVENQASTVKVYGCNEVTLHLTTPLTSNRLLLLDTLTVPADGSDGGYVEGGWNYLLFTQEGAGVMADSLYADLLVIDRG